MFEKKKAHQFLKPMRSNLFDQHPHTVAPIRHDARAMLAEAITEQVSLSTDNNTLAR
jgi:hypothetical protein